MKSALSSILEQRQRASEERVTSVVCGRCGTFSQVTGEALSGVENCAGCGAELPARPAAVEQIRQFGAEFSPAIREGEPMTAAASENDLRQVHAASVELGSALASSETPTSAASVGVARGVAWSDPELALLDVPAAAPIAAQSTEAARAFSFEPAGPVERAPMPEHAGISETLLVAPAAGADSEPPLAASPRPHRDTLLMWRTPHREEPSPAEVPPEPRLGPPPIPDWFQAELAQHEAQEHLGSNGEGESPPLTDAVASEPADASERQSNGELAAPVSPAEEAQQQPTGGEHEIVTPAAHVSSLVDINGVPTPVFGLQLPAVATQRREASAEPPAATNAAPLAPSVDAPRGAGELGWAPRLLGALRSQPYHWLPRSRREAWHSAFALVAVVAAFFMGRASRSNSHATAAAGPRTAQVASASPAPRERLELEPSASSAAPSEAGEAASALAPSAASARAAASARRAGAARTGLAGFDADAADRALAEAAARATSCRRLDNPAARATLTVTFSPSGHVATANIAGIKFGGAKLRNCMGSTLRSAQIPPFAGGPVTLKKTLRM